MPADRDPVPPDPNLFADDPALKRVDDPCQADLRIRGFAQRQRQVPSGARAVAHVVARRGPEGVGTAEPRVIEVRKEMRAVKTRWKRRPVAGAGGGHLDRAAGHTRFGVARVYHQRRRIPRVLRLEAQRWRRLVDVDRHRIPPGVRLALRPDGPIPGDARETVGSVAVDHEPRRRIGLGARVVDAAVHPADPRRPGTRHGVDGDRMVDPEARVRIVRGTERHPNRIVIHRNALGGGVDRAGRVRGIERDLEVSVGRHLRTRVNAERPTHRVGTLLPDGVIPRRRRAVQRAARQSRLRSRYRTRRWRTA